MHHTVENVSEHQALCAFKEGVHNRELNLKFGRTGVMSLSRMMEIASRYANGEEADRLRSGKKQSDKTTRITIERISARPTQPLRERLQWLIKGREKGSPKAPGPPRKERVRLEMICSTSRVPYTLRRTKRETWYIPSTPLDSVDS